MDDDNNWTPSNVAQLLIVMAVLAFFLKSCGVF